MDVTIGHLAPVRYLSTVTHREREGLLRMRTPVRIPRLARDGAIPLGPAMAWGSEGGLTLFDTQDGLFAPLRPTEGQDVQRTPIPEWRFVPALADGLVDIAFDTRSLCATPLVPWNENLDECTVVRDRSIRSLVHDGRPRAAADLTAYVAGSLRLHEGIVLHRLRGPYVGLEPATPSGSRYSLAYDIGRLSILPPHRRRLPFVATPHHAADLHGFLSGEGMAGVGPFLDEGFRREMDPDDVRLRAIERHRLREPNRDLDDLAVLLALAWGRDARRAVAEGDEAEAGRGQALAALARTLSLGCPRPEETEAALRLVRETAACVAGRPGPMERRAGILVRFLDALVLQRLPGDVPAEDLASLEGLAV